MQSTSDIWRRLRNDENAFLFYLAIRLQLGLEEILFLPPSIPCRFDDLRYIRLVIWVIERL